VWLPYRIGLIKNVEYVQRKFTKWLPGFRDIDYKMRLACLGLDSLELRQLCQDLIYKYKVVFCLTNDTFSNFFIRVSSGHTFKLYSHVSRVDVQKFFLVSES